MLHRLWTFRVDGQGECGIQPPGNPSAIHPGGSSVFHFLLTDAQAAHVELLLLEQGFEVEARTAETQSPEQHARRLAMLGHGKTIEDYPSGLCTACYWFDPVAKGFCGRARWPEETIKASLETHEAAQKGQANCPVRDW